MKSLVVMSLLAIGFVAQAQTFGTVTITETKGTGIPLTFYPEIQIFNTAVAFYPPRTGEFCIADDVTLADFGFIDKKKFAELVENKKMSISCVDGINTDPRLANGELTALELKIEASASIEIFDTKGAKENSHAVSFVVWKPVATPFLGIKSVDSGGRISLLNSGMTVGSLDLVDLAERLNSKRATLQCFRSSRACELKSVSASH